MMKYIAIESRLFVENREKLAATLESNSLAVFTSNDILPTNADGTLLFKQNSDLFYLSGVDQEESVLVLYPDAVEPKDRVLLFIRETNPELALWEGEKLTKEAAASLSGIEPHSIHWTSQMPAKLRSLILQAESIYLNMNEHARATAIVETREWRLVKQLQAEFPLHTYRRVAPLMHSLRCLKSDLEVAMIQRACELTEAGFRRVLEFVRPGVGEWEVEAEYLHEFVRNRSRGFAYTPIVASGRNACILHYIDNHQLCEDGDMLLMDVGAEYANYNADMTRCIPVNGTFTQRQRDVYDAVLRVLRHCETILRPGVFIRDYQKEVIEVMQQELINLELIEADEAAAQGEGKPLVKKYFMHGTSHHLGLDVHDVAPHDLAVQPGMVFTIEPGIYIRDEGLGIRLENDYLIGEEGNQNLMASIPIEADEIESLMHET